MLLRIHEEEAGGQLKAAGSWLAAQKRSPGKGIGKRLKFMCVVYAGLFFHFPAPCFKLCAVCVRKECVPVLGRLMAQVIFGNHCTGKLALIVNLLFRRSDTCGSEFQHKSMRSMLQQPKVSLAAHPARKWSDYLPQRFGGGFRRHSCVAGGPRIWRGERRQRHRDRVGSALPHAITAAVLRFRAAAAALNARGDTDIRPEPHLSDGPVHRPLRLRNRECRAARRPPVPGQHRAASRTRCRAGPRLFLAPEHRGRCMDRGVRGSTVCGVVSALGPCTGHYDTYYW